MCVLCIICCLSFHWWICSEDNTSENNVSIDALRALRNLGLCKLVSLAAVLTPQLSSPTPIRNCQEAPVMLCDSDDEELLFRVPNHCPRDYPGMKLRPICFYH